jgi:hypothetical protein
MTVFEYINQNFTEIERMNKANMVKYKVIHYFSIYSRYLYYLNLGNNKTQSITMASNDNYVCKTRGFDAIKQMEKEL